MQKLITDLMNYGATNEGYPLLVLRELTSEMEENLCLIYESIKKTGAWKGLGSKSLSLGNADALLENLDELTEVVESYYGVYPPSGVILLKTNYPLEENSYIRLQQVMAKHNPYVLFCVVNPYVISEKWEIYEAGMNREKISIGFKM